MSDDRSTTTHRAIADGLGELMPADPDTSILIGKVTAALESVSSNIERLERRIDSAEKDRKEEARRVYERIEAYARESASALAAVATEVTRQTTTLAGHIHHDDERFLRMENGLDEAKNDRRGIVKLLVAAGGGGGLATLFDRLFSNGPPSTP